MAQIEINQKLGIRTVRTALQSRSSRIQEKTIMYTLNVGDSNGNWALSIPRRPISPHRVAHE